MQGKFHELIMQAINECHPDTSRPSKDQTLQRFAELIVKECIDIMQEQSHNTSMLLCNPPKSSAIWDASNAIKKKFGVE
jgi:hypothetical protein